MTEKISKTESEWQSQLTAEQYAVCRQHATERAFTGKYYACKDTGIYHCAACKQALFSSTSKYDSGSGWPSYWQPITDTAVETSEDNSHGMQRIEVHCSRCGSHLGHIFPDGPQPTGLRYCINSLALDFTPATAEPSRD